MQPPRRSNSVCPECFIDEGMKKFVANSATEKSCSYCFRSSRKKFAAEMEDVCRHIEDCLGREYEMPEESTPRDDESESGWFINPTDSYDLLSDLGFGDGPQALFDDLVQEFCDRAWVQRDPLGLLPCDEWRYSWEAFSEQVRHKVRFMFLKVRTQDDFGPDPEPHTVLRAIENCASTLKLVRSLPAGTPMIRARQHREDEVVTHATHLGSPPKESARQNRMSPAGIPMFYGSATASSAIEETIDFKREDLGVMTVGTFCTVRALNLLDLTDLPAVPSLFSDDKTYERRMPLIFMHAFVKDMVKPIARDGREHIEYIPTQVVCEYIRHCFNRGKLPHINGIRYRSSRQGGGICYTIFCENKECVDEVHIKSLWGPEPILVLTKTEKRVLDFANQSLSS
jgi:hypothetical protein